MVLGMPVANGVLSILTLGIAMKNATLIIMTLGTTIRNAKHYAECHN